MDQQRTWILLSKYLAGEAAADELEWVFRTNPDLRKTMETLQALKQAPPKGITVEEEQMLLKKGLERFTHPGKNSERFMSVVPDRDIPQKILSPSHRTLPYRW